MGDKIEVISVDYDGTITIKDEFPFLGEINPMAKEVLQKFHNNGGKIILNTCRYDEFLEAAVMYCELNEVPIDYVNCNIPERISAYGDDCRKIGADVYIDNRDYYSLRTGSVDWDMIDTLLNGD